MHRAHFPSVRPHHRRVQLAAFLLFLRRRRYLGLLREARSTSVGLFPRFDPGKLEEAELRLARVIGLEEENSYLALEAYYFSGIAKLARHDVSGAYDAFQQVIAGSGQKTPQARQLVAELELLESR
jgi:hypothetical protein